MIPLLLAAAAASPYLADRTADSQAVLRFLTELEATTDKGWSDGLEITNGFGGEPLTASDFSDYANRCFFKELHPTYAKNGFGPIIVTWECDSKASDRVAAFWLRNAKIQTTATDYEEVAPIPIKVVPSERTRG